jgi:hypothetical protein
MPRRKQTKSRSQADVDDPVFRALRQVADEALEEDIPERLLRLIRAAPSQPSDEGKLSERPPEQPSKADDAS